MKCYRLDAVVSAFALAAMLSIPATADEKKVLVIGLDGVRPDALAIAATPNVDSLKNGTFANGDYRSFYSPEAQVDPISSVSGTNYSGILTGVFATKHGVVGNSFRGINFDDYPDFFTRIEEFNPNLKTFRVIRWGPGADQMPTGADHSINVETTRTFAGGVHSSDVGNTNAVVQLLAGTHPTIADDPDIIFHFYSGPDSVGHTFGFGPTIPEYVAELENVDGLIGQELSSVAARPHFANEDWLIVITSDHGGGSEASGPTGHAGNQPLDRSVPFLIASRSVKAGEPTPRPNLVDVAPTVLTHMRLPIRPKWTLDGSVVGIAPLLLGDLNFDGAIDRTDWQTLRDNHLADLSGLTLEETYALGDLDGDGDNDEQDFSMFKSSFDESNGLGALDEMTESVPEPPLLLIALGGGALCLVALFLKRAIESKPEGTDH